MKQMKGSCQAALNRVATCAAFAALCLALLVAAGGCSKPSTTPAQAAANASAAVVAREATATAAPTAASTNEVQPPQAAAPAATVAAPSAEAPSSSTAVEVGAANVSPDAPAATEPAMAEPAKAAPLPKLVDYGALTCTPCKMMEPILKDMAETQKAHFGVEFIDVRYNLDMAKQHAIRYMPTQIFYDAQGRELYRHVGFYSREEILAKWRELGFEVGS